MFSAMMDTTPDFADDGMDSLCASFESWSPFVDEATSTSGSTRTSSKPASSTAFQITLDMECDEEDRWLGTMGSNDDVPDPDMTGDPMDCDEFMTCIIQDNLSMGLTWMTPVTNSFTWSSLLNFEQTPGVEVMDLEDDDWADL